MLVRTNIYKQSVWDINIYEIFPSILVFAFAMVDILSFYNFISINLRSALFIVIGIVSIAFTIFKNGIKIQIPMILFMLIYIFFGAICGIVNGNADVQELLWVFAFMGVAMLLLNSNINYTMCKSIYYFFVIFTSLKIILSGGVDNLHTLASRNTIGLMAIFYLALFAIAAKKNSKSIGILPVIFGLLCAVLAVGRSGILSFLILTFLFLIFDFKGEREKIRGVHKIIGLLSLLVVSGMLIFLMFPEIFSDALLHLQKYGMESVRTEIWSDYIEKTLSSLKNIIFGAHIGGTVLLEQYSHNLHNSFLMLHAKYGLVMLVIVLLMIVRTAVSFIRTKNFLFLSMLIVILFRMQLDYTNFNAQMDIILYFLMFYDMFENSKLKNMPESLIVKQGTYWAMKN